MKKRLLCLLFALFLLIGLAACNKAVPTPTGPIGEKVDGTASIVSDRCHIEYDQPEDYRLDITLPLLQEDLPGAGELNAQIASDYDRCLNRPPEEYFLDYYLICSYQFVHYWYEVYRFDQLYEIVVHYETYSLEASEIWSNSAIYCYDAEAGCAMTVEDFLHRINIAETDIVETLKEAYIEGYNMSEKEADECWKTLDDCMHRFFIDENKQIQIVVSE